MGEVSARCAPPFALNAFMAFLGRDIFPQVSSLCGSDATNLITKMIYGVIISIYYDDDSILEIHLKYINYRTATISTKIRTRDNDATINIKTFLEKINLPTDTDEYYELRNLFQDPETIHKYDNYKRSAIPQNPQILFDVWEQFIDIICPQTASNYVLK
jgi:hypothetical protein